MSDRRHGTRKHAVGAGTRLGAADRLLIRTAAIDLMLHLSRTLPSQVRRRRKRAEPGPGST